MNQGLVRLKKNRTFLLMLLPGTLCFLAFNYLPLAGLVMAFKKVNYSDGFFRSPWVGFENFEFFFKTPDAFVITRNTLAYNAVFIVFGMLFAVSCAIALNEVKNQKLSKFFQSTMFLPYFLSWIVVSYLAYSFLSPSYGILNSVRKFFGAEPLNWYAVQSPWPFFLIFLHAWKYTGYNCVVYLASIAGIDESLYEAAEIDGASKWKQILNITIPSLTPVIIIMTVLALGRIFNADFGLFYQVTLGLGNGILKPVAEVADTYVYSALRNTGDIGMASAANLYQSVVGFITILTANWIVKKISSENSLF